MREQPDANCHRAEVIEIVKKALVADAPKLLDKAVDLIRTFTKGEQRLRAIRILGLPQHGLHLSRRHQLCLRVGDVPPEPTVAARVATDIGHRHKDVARERDACRKGKHERLQRRTNDVCGAQVLKRHKKRGRFTTTWPR